MVALSFGWLDWLAAILLFPPRARKGLFIALSA
jgi:hypothetical protein